MLYVICYYVLHMDDLDLNPGYGCYRSYCDDGYIKDIPKVPEVLLDPHGHKLQ